jgi:hypothetical protein
MFGEYHIGQSVKNTFAADDPEHIETTQRI